MACFLLIMLFVLDESSYDRYNTDAGLIYRVDEHIKFGDFLYNGALTPSTMGPSFAREFQHAIGKSLLVNDKDSYKSE